MAARPLLGAALAVLAGAGIGAWPPQRPSVVCAAAAGALGLWAALLLARRAAAAMRAGIAALLLAGAARTQTDLHPLYRGETALAEGDAVVTGRVAASPVRRGRDQVLVLGEARVRRGDATEVLRDPLQLILEENAEPCAPGDRLLVRGRVSAMRGDRNLGWFPAPAAPAGRRCAGRITVGSPVWVRRLEGRREGGPGAAVLRWREAAAARWRGLGGASGALLNALTTGERGDLPRETEEAFQRSGLTHLIAISGMNVSFLVAGTFLVLRRSLASWERLALRWPVPPLAAAATLPFLWFFYRFSGSQIPVGRATLMAAAGLAALLLGRRIGAPEACALAALAYAVVDPPAVFSPSYQLSFAAVAALVLVAPRLPPRPEGEEKRSARLWRQTRSLLLASLAAGGAAAPLVAFHFQQVSLIGPLANLVGVPFTGLLVLPAAWLAMLVAAACPPAGAVAEAAASHLASALIRIAEFFAAPPWAWLGVPRPPLAVTLALLALAAALTAPARAWPGVRRLRAVALAASALACCWWLGARSRQELRAVFLDVGQGMAALVLPPGGGDALLVDAGPRWPDDDAGRRVVVPALLKLGARRLAALALTHPHPDHTGGAGSVLERIAAGALWLGGAFPHPPGGRRDGGGGLGGTFPGGVIRLRRGERRELAGGVSVEVLNPPCEAGAGGAGADPNDLSLALLLSWRDAGLLVAADLGPAASREAAAAISRRPRRLALQAPHHGASPEACRSLGEALAPELAIVSVGRNGYGHPRAESVAALARFARVLRTDRDGAVFLRSDGGRWEVSTWRERALSRSWGERLRWLFEGW